MCHIVILTVIFVFGPRNNDKTTRNNEINERREIFRPAIYRL